MPYIDIQISGKCDPDFIEIFIQSWGLWLDYRHLDNVFERVGLAYMRALSGLIRFKYPYLYFCKE